MVLYLQIALIKARAERNWKIFYFSSKVEVLELKWHSPKRDEIIFIIMNLFYLGNKLLNLMENIFWDFALNLLVDLQQNQFMNVQHPLKLPLLCLRWPWKSLENKFWHFKFQGAPGAAGKNGFPVHRNFPKNYLSYSFTLCPSSLVSTITKIYRKFS